MQGHTTYSKAAAADELSDDQEDAGEDFRDEGANMLAPEQAIQATPQDWRAALDKVIPCVVAIKFMRTRSFDTGLSSVSIATGFIVDKDRGLVLTNRHVVTPGPCRAMATFHNREMLPLLPVYYDPVHDFGFYRFNPSELRFMTVDEVQLAPEEACVGLEIRVIGNDTGEKVSILAGTLARLDRDAPAYSSNGYNDFNVFYMQAASNTKGGSSGSPVIDHMGRAVGLNAGGKTKGASAFYLPLDRVARALKLVQDANALPLGPQWTAPCIHRGDLQTTFVFKGFDEVRRLGLSAATEEVVRGSGVTTGMLVVERVVPGSPADGKLEPGDVLLSINGEVITHFMSMESILDDAVGGSVVLVLERGDQRLQVQLEVTDLHTVTPAAFLEVGRASLHPLSYQQARNHRVAVGGVYVADPGDMLARAAVPRFAMVTALANVPTPDLAAFAQVLRRQRPGTKVPLEYYVFSERHTRKTTLLQVDTTWYPPPTYWSRDDSLGIWRGSADWPPHTAASDEVVTDAPSPAAALGDSAVAVEEDSPSPSSSDDAPEWTADEIDEHMRRCMALVDVFIPHVAGFDGVARPREQSAGIIVWLGVSEGLLLVDRYTVLISSCDIFLAFNAYPVEVRGRVQFLHPLHNFALIAFNLADLPPEARAKIRVAQLLPEPPLKRGETVRLVVLTRSMRLMSRQSAVTNATVSQTLPYPVPPRFRPIHEELVVLEHDFGSTAGALVDSRGRLRALYAMYRRRVHKDEVEFVAGLPADIVAPWLNKVISGMESRDPSVPRHPTVRVTNAELEVLPLAKAAQYGLPRPWVSLLDKLDQERRQTLRVHSCLAGSHASKVLKPGDMVLAVAGRPVTSFRHVEAIIAGYSCDSEPCGLPADAEGAAALLPPCQPPQAEGVGPDGSAMETDGGQQAGGTGSAGTAEPTDGEAAGTSGTAPPLAVPFTICRAGVVQQVEVQLSEESSMGTRRALHWCGALLQPPHRAVTEVGQLPDNGTEGVYVGLSYSGSPAANYQLSSQCYVVELNGRPTPGLDEFLQVAQGLHDGQFVRVKTFNPKSNKVKVLSIQVDLLYWPLYEFRWDASTDKWQRLDITSAEVPLTLPAA